VDELSGAVLPGQIALKEKAEIGRLEAQDELRHSARPENGGEVLDGMDGVDGMDGSGKSRNLVYLMIKMI